MRVVPLIAGLVASAALAPALLRGLAAGRHVRTNYRGEALPTPFGLLIVLGAVFAAALATLVALVADDGEALPTFPAFVLVVGLLGLVDDQFTTDARGLRGHLRAALRGEFSTGAVKAVGTVALAVTLYLPFYVEGAGDLHDGLLTVAVLVLATNLFNLLDLRPGRTLKAFVLVVAGCAPFLEDGQLWALGVLIGPIVVAGVLDLRERAMLGDTGSNVIGATAGVLLVTATGTGADGLPADPSVPLAAIAAVLLLITLYGELRSINALVESTPGLKHLDSLGRPA